MPEIEEIVTTPDIIVFSMGDVVVRKEGAYGHRGRVMRVGDFATVVHVARRDGGRYYALELTGYGEGHDSRMFRRM